MVNALTELIIDSSAADEQDDGECGDEACSQSKSRLQMTEMIANWY